MRRLGFVVAGAVTLTIWAVPAALARGGGGGDREPAGGAYMTSYPEQGSTGIQRGGPPRSSDIPRDVYGRPLGRMPLGYPR